MIIGAGPSGLIALKELREAGLDCLAVDSGARLGGAFDIDRPGAPVYESTRLTTSNYFTAYSCFPPPPDEPRRFWSHREYIEYLRRFADAYGLVGAIRFATRARAITPDDRGAVVELVTAGEVTRTRFDTVNVASGINQRPFIPKIPGLDDFTGSVVHAQVYRDARPFAGRRVLCVGFGETGADVAHEIAQVASDAMLSTRHTPVIVERYPNGGAHPGDALTTRSVYRLDPYARSLRFMRHHRDIFERTADPYARLLAEWNVRTGGRHGFWLTKNEAPVRDIAEGRLKFNMAGIARVDGHAVVFHDGQRFPCDAIVFSTGYTFRWPFPAVPFRDVRDLYKHMLHPDLGSRVAFVGWVRPDLGGVPTCAELQSRYLARLLTGERPLPGRREMIDIATRDRARHEALFCNAVDPATVVPYSEYCDDLARLIGCHPLEDGQIRDPALLLRLWFGSQIGAQYRLTGPGSQPVRARRTLMRLPIALSNRTMARHGLRLTADRIFPALGRLLRRRDQRQMSDIARGFADTHGRDVPSRGAPRWRRA